MYSNNGMINRRLFGTLKKKKPLKEREGPAATLGGGKFSRGALNYLRTSHSPTPWQISRGSSCAPTVKKPPRGALGNTERLHSTQARGFSSMGLWSFTWISNISTMTQPSKKRTPCPYTLKAKKLPKDATKKSFKRSAVLSADRFPPLTLEHHCKR